MVGSETVVLKEELHGSAVYFKTKTFAAVVIVLRSVDHCYN